MGSRRALAFAVPIVVVSALGFGVAWFPGDSRPTSPGARPIEATPLAESHKVTETTTVSTEAVDLNLVRRRTRAVAQHLRLTARLLAGAGADGRLTADDADNLLGAIDDADGAISSALDPAAAIAKNASTDSTTIAALTAIVGHLGTCADALDRFESTVQVEVPPEFADIEPFVVELRTLADDTAEILRARA